MAEECEETNALSAWHSTTEFVILTVLVLFWLPFAARFSYQLWKLPDHNSLVMSCFIYMAAVMTFIVTRWYLIVFEPPLQKIGVYSLSNCSFQECMNKASSLLGYIALVNIFVSRIKISFKDSVYSVHPWLLNGCTIANLMNGVFMFAALSSQSSQIDCYQPTHSGVMYHLGLAHRSYKTCNIPAEGVVSVAYGLYSAVLFVLNGMLGYFFVSRLRKVIRDCDAVDSPHSAENMEFRILIQKSTVVGLASAATFILALIVTGVASLSVVMAIDLCLNLVFIYCLFHFGHDLYERLFGRIVTRVRTRTLTSTKDDLPSIKPEMLMSQSSNSSLSSSTVHSPTTTFQSKQSEECDFVENV